MKEISLADDIEWEKLYKLVEGYSGADVANVCREAAMMPMRKKLASGNFDIMNIGNMTNEIEAPLSMEDFVEATRNISKSVSQEQLKEYDEWMKQFGAV